MAPGYVIAVGCEVLGLIGLVLGLARVWAERSARVAGLRGFLRSGVSPPGEPPKVAVRATPRHRAAPFVPAAGPPRDSAARSALHRAVRAPSAQQRVEAAAA